MISYGPNVSWVFVIMFFRDGGVTLIDAYNWSTTNYWITQTLSIPEKSYLISAWAPGRRLLTCTSHDLEVKRLFQAQRQENSIITEVGKIANNQYMYETIAYMISNYMHDHLTLQDIEVSSSAEYVAMLFYVEDSIEPKEVTHPLVEVFKCVDKDAFTLVQHW